MRRLAALALLVLAAVLILRRRFARPVALPASPSPEAPALAPGPRFLSVPWTLVEASAEEAELAIRADVPEPLALDRVDVRETPTQVFVTVIARSEPEPPELATSAAEPRDARVRLSRPLGGRELIHAPADLDAAAHAPQG